MSKDKLLPGAKGTGSFAPVEEEHKPAIFKFDKLSPLYLRTEQNESIQDI